MHPLTTPQDGRNPFPGYLVSMADVKEAPLPPISVLVVEDEAIIALDLKRKLIRLGCAKVESTPEGAGAIALAEELQPDVIIMDVGLRGDMDGITTATIIHERFGTPIIFASAYRDRAALSLADSGVSASWLVKPFSESDLQLSIQSALIGIKG